MIHQQEKDTSSEEDILKNDQEENVNISDNDNMDNINISNNNDDIDIDVDKIIDENNDEDDSSASGGSSSGSGVDEEEDSSDSNDNNNDEESEEEQSAKLVRKNPEIETNKNESNVIDDESNNQYLKNHSSIDEQFGKRKIMKPDQMMMMIINRQHHKRHQQQQKNHHNLTAPVKKKSLFRNHNPKSIQTTTVNSLITLPTITTTEKSFNEITMTTIATPTTTNNNIVLNGEMDESLNLSDEHFIDLEDEFNQRNIKNQTKNDNDDDDDKNLKNRLIKKRKPQHVGKWMDFETFELRNDADNIDDDDTDDEDDDVDDHESTITQSPLPVVDIDFKPVVRKPVMMAKEHFTINNNNNNDNIRQRFSNSPRFIRQNIPDDTDGSMLQLGQTLSGIPGEDYPIFSTIPRTNFNCLDHKWPGYYADIDTQCQVFHICQSGGRKNSFLCPNGTMFNQQLFTCDWWHNVQCDQVAKHYELNAQIYNENHQLGNNWESIRSINDVNDNSIRSKSQPLRVSIRRMALLDNIDNSTDDHQSLWKITTRTTSTSDIDNSTTTTLKPVTKTTTTSTTELPISTQSLPFGARRSNSLKFRQQTIKSSSLQEREQTTIPTTTALPITTTTTIPTIITTTVKSSVTDAVWPVQQQQKYNGIKGGGNRNMNNGNPIEMSKFSRVIQQHKAKSIAAKQQQQQQQNLKPKQQQQQFQSFPKTSTTASTINNNNNNNLITKFTRHKFAHQSQLTRTTPLPQLLSTSTQNGHSSSSSSSSPPKSLRFQSSPMMMMKKITPSPLPSSRMISTTTRSDNKYFRT
uniref:Chitin-binding type-2 domain-containing protein n=1 Tax=Dermatophagoides pteronyssinus TaxID=6956 RepID=A0A6P6XTX4_DERPT|nr:putative uncharacterized protein DDB_G0287457 [Dermatophagoides pteronyssinus]